MRASNIVHQNYTKLEKLKQAILGLSECETHQEFLDLCDIIKMRMMHRALVKNNGVLDQATESLGYSHGRIRRLFENHFPEHLFLMHPGQTGCRKEVLG